VEPNDGSGEADRFFRLDAPFRAGDLATISQELGDQTGFPDVMANPAIGSCLTYAIYHGSASLVAALLDPLGASKAQTALANGTSAGRRSALAGNLGLST